jgi:hypothetical protein
VRAEARAPLLELAPDLGEVVDLAVVGDDELVAVARGAAPVAAAPPGHGLVAALAQVEDRQPAVAERDLLVVPEPAVVWPAMDQRRGHPRDEVGVPASDARDAAHGAA